MKSRSKANKVDVPTTTNVPAYQKRSIAANPIVGREDTATELPPKTKAPSSLQQKLNKQSNVVLRPQLTGNTRVVDGRVSTAPKSIEPMANDRYRMPMMTGPQGQPMINNRNNNNGYFFGEQPQQQRIIAAPIPQRPVSSVSGSSGLGSGNLSTGGQEMYIIGDGDDFISGKWFHNYIMNSS